MNWKKIVIGSGLTAAIIYIWTAFVAGLVSSVQVLADVEGLLMGMPLFMGAFVYVVADKLNSMYNK